MLVIVTTISKSQGKIISGPDSISRGFIYGPDAEALMNEVNESVRSTINSSANMYRNQRVMKQDIKKTLEKFLYSRTKRKPMILPIIIDI